MIMPRSGVTIFQLVKQVVKGSAIYNLCLHCIGCEENRQRKRELSSFSFYISVYFSNFEIFIKVPMLATQSMLFSGSKPIFV